MRTVRIKDEHSFRLIKQLSDDLGGVFRKHDGSKLVEVIHFGKYGYASRVFTTERTLKEALAGR